MRLFPPPLEITDNEGFSEAKDLFGRAETAAGMTNLLQKVVDPLVIAVDGQWGCGKTTFLKMWAGELRKQAYPVVYFDAFAHDYVDDAFSAIADEIIALAESQKKLNHPAFKSLVGRVARIGQVIGRSALKVGTKALTLGALDTADLHGVASAVSGDVAEEVSQLTDKIVERYLQDHRVKKALFEQFQASLSELPTLLQVQEAGDQETHSIRPLVFIIDELDRCRPHFALQILERIKHFYSAPKIHFVLGVHLDQLRNSVCAAYGPGINAQRYLEKFLHLTVHLVDSKEFFHERDAKNYTRHWMKEMQFQGKDADVVDALLPMVENIAEHHELSFRTIERILMNVALAVQSTPANYLRLPPIVGGLCVLKVTNPALFVKAKLGTLQYEEVVSPLSLHWTRGEELKSGFVDTCWKHCLGHASNRELAQSLIGYNISDPTKIVPRTANIMIDWWKDRAVTGAP